MAVRMVGQSREVSAGLADALRAGVLRLIVVGPAVS
jgi:hypothetical protein